MEKRAYKSPLREEQARLTRDRILDAALTLFVAQGYGATSIAADRPRGRRRAGDDLCVARFEAGDRRWPHRTGRPAPGRGRDHHELAGPAGRSCGASSTSSPRSRPRFWVKNERLASVFRQGTGDTDIAGEWTAPSGRRDVGCSRSCWPAGRQGPSEPASRSRRLPTSRGRCRRTRSSRCSSANASGRSRTSKPGCAMPFDGRLLRRLRSSRPRARCYHPGHAGPRREVPVQGGDPPPGQRGGGAGHPRQRRGPADGRHHEPALRFRGVHPRAEPAGDARAAGGDHAGRAC